MRHLVPAASASMAILILVILCSCLNRSRQTGITQDDSLNNRLRNSQNFSGTFTTESGAVIRGNKAQRRIALVFTGDEFGDGGEFIAGALNNQKIKGSFFLTGNFYRNKSFSHIIMKLKNDGNYLGSHSDRHLLYCDWNKRDSLLVTKDEFLSDLKNSYHEMQKSGIRSDEALFFLPPYEWYNDTISSWARQTGLRMINFTPGTRSNADYTYPEMGNGYINSRIIWDSIISFEEREPAGLNGFILLIHIGTDPRRSDKFYFYLPQLIIALKERGYQFVRIDELLN